MTDYNRDQWTVTEGADVVGSDGEKLGEVVNAYPDYLVVKKGFFFPNDYYVPSSAIANVDEGHVYLNVTKDQALNQEPSWENEPVSSTTTTTTYDDVATSTASTGLAGATTTDLGTEETLTTTSSSTGYDVDQDAARSQTVAGDDIRVSLAEEELTATTREVERGEVEVRKNVVAEEQVLEVPVTEERVNIERRVVDRDVSAGDHVFEEGTIEVPIHGEEVDVHKEARVTEEIRIGKEQVQSTERVADTVRREEVEIVDETGGAAGTTGTTNTGATETVETTVTETTYTDDDDRGTRGGSGNPI
jgi:uncharacterized protein (TIGR02271 family)